jgi:PhnB protein
MTTSHKPQSYSTVSPYLIVSGASETISFLERVFGAVALRRFPDEHGKLMHSEVRIDDTVVMIADGGEGWPPVPAYVHVYVSDVDATYRLALEAGATSVQEPVKKEDEDKRGGVKDAGGTTWWIATKVE